MMYKSFTRRKLPAPTTDFDANVGADITILISGDGHSA